MKISSATCQHRRADENRRANVPKRRGRRNTKSYSHSLPLSLSLHLSFFRSFFLSLFLAFSLSLSVPPQQDATALSQDRIAYQTVLAACARARQWDEALAAGRSMSSRVPEGVQGSAAVAAVQTSSSVHVLSCKGSNKTAQYNPARASSSVVHVLGCSRHLTSENPSRSRIQLPPRTGCQCLFFIPFHMNFSRHPQNLSDTHSPPQNIAAAVVCNLYL